MISWHYIVTCACLLLLFLLWKEIIRENKSRIRWRVAASIIAVGSLTGMALPMVGKINKNTSHASGEAILLTGGFNQDTLDIFLESKAQDIPVYTTDQSIVHRLQNQPATFIPDISFFPGQPTPEVIHILGDGLREDELRLLNPVPVTFHFSDPRPAVSSVYWPRKIKAGEALYIQGMFDNVSSAEVKLFLKGLNGITDSVTIPSNKKQDFELQAIPKYTGRAVYEFIAVSGKDTLENEPIPVEVGLPGTLKILMLASSPDFENKFLKDWLSEQGYSLTVLTTISKNKYDRQFLNMPKVSASPLTASYLDKFDIIIADAGELTSISKSELEMIRSQVEKKGSGLITRADSAENKNSFYSKPFPLFRAKHTLQPSFVWHAGDSIGRSFALHTENPVCIRYEEGTQALLQDRQSNIFVSSSMYGSGKIILTTLNNTYSLALSGNRADYESLWSLLLQKAARKTDAGADWQTLPAFTYPGEPTQLHLETTAGNLPFGQASERVVYLKQNALLPFQWQGIYWPVQTGWQPILSPQEPAYWWYVYQPGDWAKLLSFQKINDTKKYMSGHPYSLTTTPHVGTKDLMQALKIYFFFACILCWAFLWIEQKI